MSALVNDLGIPVWVAVSLVSEDDKEKDGQISTRARHHLKRMRELASQWKGKVLKTDERAQLLEFENEVNAVSWALDYQNRVMAGNMLCKEKDEMWHRVGIAFSEKESLAANAQSERGGICLSEKIYSQSQQKMNIKATEQIEGEKTFYRVIFNTHLPERYLEHSFRMPWRQKDRALRVVVTVIVVLFVGWIGKYSLDWKPWLTRPPQVEKIVLPYVERELGKWSEVHPLVLTRPPIGVDSRFTQEELKLWKENRWLVTQDAHGEKTRVLFENVPVNVLVEIAGELVNQNGGDPASLHVKDFLDRVVVQDPLPGRLQSGQTPPQQPPPEHR